MNILSFDVEEWFNLLDIPATENIADWDRFEPRIHQNVDRLLEATLKHGHRATFFCLGWVAGKYPEVIQKIDKAGFEIASHTHTHQLVYQQTPGQFRQDVKRSIYTLEDVTGKKVKSFRAPGFSFIRGNPWAFEALIELGIERDSSIFPVSRGHGGYENFGPAQPSLLECKGGTLKEFPISLGRLFGKEIVYSGGGYFRLLPYNTIQRLTQNADYVMSYFHPRDFDAGQPALKIPLHRRFKSYVGLLGAEKKLCRWLTDFKFVDIQNADKNIDWAKAKRVFL